MDVMLPKRDWDDAFANMAHIPGSDALPAKWAADAAEYRGAHSIELDIPYGKHSRERFDLVWPDVTPKGLAVFVHGGFWIRTGKSDWTHYAEGLRAQGWAVALPGYVLAPEARIAEITQQIGRAIISAADMVPGPIRLAGHSAGGHLVSRMVCADCPLSDDVLNRLAHTVSISGLHDLRPLMWTAMNAQQGIDETEAQRESAALQRPVVGANVTAWVGGGERPEFMRQTQLLAMMWQGLEANIRCVIDKQHDHFSVIEGLRDPSSDIIKTILK